MYSEKLTNAFNTQKLLILLFSGRFRQFVDDFFNYCYAKSVFLIYSIWLTFIQIFIVSGSNKNCYA